LLCRVRGLGLGLRKRFDVGECVRVSVILRPRIAAKHLSHVGELGLQPLDF
jgi:hypothetical protein